jgi:hypothetical protein
MEPTLMTFDNNMSLWIQKTCELPNKQVQVGRIEPTVVHRTQEPRDRCGQEEIHCKTEAATETHSLVWWAIRLNDSRVGDCHVMTMRDENVSLENSSLKEMMMEQGSTHL